ncbi:RidA family protein [Nocardiopsis alba]|uniref:RidA family protein n=1 Tax=Nocardiopsis alba TaxID=53437 RepID=UPI0033FE75F2
MAKPYSDALTADGPLLFVSGQVPAGPGGEAPGGIGEQTRQVFRNMEAVLVEHGVDLSHVVKMTYYLRHISDLEEFREALLACLPEGHLPAATLVEVGGLVDPTYLVEIDAIASLPRDRG